MKGLHDFLRPEFLARIDEIVVFTPLSVESYAKIAKLMLSELENPLKEKQIELSISDEVYTAVAEKSHGGKYGGRDIRRVIRSDIEDVIAETIIDNADKQLEKILITAENGEIKVTAQ